MSKVRTYPYRPVRVSQLSVGELWPIELGDGQFACGVVLDPAPTNPHNGNPKPGQVLLGLLDWVSRNPPTVADVADATELLHHAYGGASSINRYGAEIIGQRDLEQSPLAADERLSHRAGGPVWVLSAGRRVRQATEEERQSMRILGALGYSGLRPLAQRYFC